MPIRGRRSTGGRGRRSGSARRQSQWVDTNVSAQIGSGARLDATLLGGLGAQDIPGLTVVRTIGTLWFLSTVPGGSNGANRLDLGVGLVQGEALAAGVTADPETASDFPLRGWVHRDSIIVVEAIDSNDPAAVGMRWDARVSRKLLTQDSEFMVTFTNTNVQGTALTVDVEGWIRCLFLMP